MSPLQHMEEIPKVRHALVVEDDSFWRSMIQEALLTYNPNIRLNFASTAQDINEILKTDQTIELVIFDYSPNDSVTELDLWDRLIEQYSQIPYLLLSGIAPDELMKRIISARMKGNPRIVEKPDSLLELSEQLNRAMSFYFLKRA
jgi:DNA-binding NtrC family response regulator